MILTNIFGQHASGIVITSQEGRYPDPSSSKNNNLIMISLTPLVPLLDFAFSNYSPSRRVIGFSLLAQRSTSHRFRLLFLLYLNPFLIFHGPLVLHGASGYQQQTSHHLPVKGGTDDNPGAQ
jgi:hypothetical protein